MSKHYAAMSGKIGSTEYYILALAAKDLAESTELTTPAKWKKMTVEERYQRKLDVRRVRHIASYFSTNRGRFFGSIVIGLNKKPHFEKFELMLGKPQERSPMFDLIAKDLDSLGVLTLKGDEQWLPLDGQHRISAIRCAIKGTDENGKECDFPPSAEVGEDIVTVILIPDCSIKTSRRIFTKINRNARKTQPSDNLILDDDDIIAVLCRKVANEVFGGRLVSWKNNINKGEEFFTTLKAIEYGNLEILKREVSGSIDRTQLPAETDRKLMEKTVLNRWRSLVEDIEHFSLALEDPTEGGDDLRKDMREACLLLKPAPQMSLLQAFARLIGNSQDGTPGGQPLSCEEACKRLNKIDWQTKAPVWDRVFVSGEKIMPKNFKLAGELIYYMVGGKLADGEKAKLLAKYRSVFPNDDTNGNMKKELPDKVV